MIFIKILKNTIQIRNVKYKSYLMVWLLICLVAKIRGRELNFSLVFITQSDFAVLKDIRLNYIHHYYENSKQTRTSTNCI